MKLTMTLAIAVLATSVFAQQQPAPADALDGVDTVILLKEGKEVFGKSAFKTERGGFTYLFSTAETKAEFDKAPEKYEIQLGGICARMGKTTGANPGDYFVHDGKIYIFGSDACHKAFAAAPDKYLPKAAAPMPRDAAAAQRGMALLDKAAAAIGGKIDSLTTYADTVSEVQKRPNGDEMKITTRWAWNFPSSARFERMMTRSDGQKGSYGTLLVGDKAWGIGGDEPRPVNAHAVPSVQMDLGRQIVPLLRSRKDPGTRVAALGSGTVDGVTVERVRVQRGGLDVTVNIDPATRKIHSTSFIDRNRQGEYGEFLLTYADFRTVDGLTVPFEEKAQFNGTPDPAASRKLDTVSVNATLDPTLFKVAR